MGGEGGIYCEECIVGDIRFCCSDQLLFRCRWMQKKSAPDDTAPASKIPSIHIDVHLLFQSTKLRTKFPNIRELMSLLQFSKKSQLMPYFMTMYSKDKKLHYKCRVIQSGTWDHGIGVIFLSHLHFHHKRTFSFWCSFLFLSEFSPKDKIW